MDSQTEGWRQKVREKQSVRQRERKGGKVRQTETALQSCGVSECAALSLMFLITLL